MARDSSGTKNQPQYASTGAPSDAADLTEVANYAALVGNRKAGTASQRAALTGADLWNGLEFHETDTGCVYDYQSGWVLVGIVGFVQNRVAALVGDSIANGATLATLSIPALPVATRVIIDVAGTLGFSGATQNLGVGIGVSAGVLSQPANEAVPVATPNWAQYARKAFVDLPANSALTVTFVAESSASNAYYRLQGELRVLLPGQY